MCCHGRESPTKRAIDIYIYTYCTILPNKSNQSVHDSGVNVFNKCPVRVGYA